MSSAHCIALLVTHCVDRLLITTMQPPSSFLVTMEEYIREAPRADTESKGLVSVSSVSGTAKGQST